MKKATAILLALALCMSMAGCLRVGTPGDMPEETVDPTGEPVIVVDETDVTKENCYDAEGTLIGYCQYIGGTNCGNSGIVRIDFLDLSGNVINTFSPKFAGGTLGSGQFGSFEHGQYEVTDIWESDYNAEAVNSNSYILIPHSGGQIYVYLEDREGRTVRCDLFGTDGQVVSSLTPNNPAYELEVDRYEPDHFMVSEGYTEEEAHGPTRYTERITYYDRGGAFLCELALTLVENAETQEKDVTRYDVKNAAGEVVRSYDRTAEDFELNVWYDTENGTVYASDSKIIYDPMSVLLGFEEYYDAAQALILFREKPVYQDGTRIDTEYTVFGGKVVKTDSPISGLYEKLEFYDADGTLKKTVTADAGSGLSLRWDNYNKTMDILVLDASGNQIGWDSYSQP